MPTNASLPLSLPPSRPRTALHHAHLSRLYVSCEALNSNHTTVVSEFMSPMAPERYIALPHCSMEAAKALIAVFVAKGGPHVVNLEKFRSRGSKQKQPSKNDWFDHVLGGLLKAEQQMEFESVVDRLKGLDVAKMNTPNITPNHLPLDCLNAPRTDMLETVRTPTMPSASSALSSVPNSQEKPDSDIEIVAVTTVKPPPRQPVRPPPPPKRKKLRTARYARRSGVVPPRRPLPSNKLFQSANDNLDMADDILSLFDDTPAPAKKAPTPPPLSTTEPPSTATITTTPQLPPSQQHVQKQRQKHHLPVKLVFDDDTGRVSIDFDIIPVPANQDAVKADTPHTNKLSGIPPQVFPAPDVLDVDFSLPLGPLEGDADFLLIRADAPPSQLDALLRNIDSSSDNPPLSPVKQKSPAKDVVMLDTERDADASRSTPASSRRQKRRRSRAQEELNILETEQRASEIRSRVATALRPEHLRRKRLSKTATPPAPSKSRASPALRQEARRPTRKAKQTPVRYAEPSDSDEKDSPQSSDDHDFAVDDGDVEVLPKPAGNADKSTPAPMSTPSALPAATAARPAAKQAKAPPKRLARHEPIEIDTGFGEIRSARTKQPSKTDGAPASRSRLRRVSLRESENVPSNDILEVNPASPPSDREPDPQPELDSELMLAPVDPPAQFSRRRRSAPLHTQAEVEEDELDGEITKPLKHQWEREMEALDKLRIPPEDRSPSLSSSDHENEVVFYDDRLPILKRILDPVQRGTRDLFDQEPLDETKYMREYYQTHHRAPPAVESELQGTKFLIEIYERHNISKHNVVNLPEEGDFSTAPYLEPTLPLVDLGTNPLDVFTMDSRKAIGSDRSTPSSSMAGSSDEEGYGIVGEKRSRAIARHRASKARELQSRVCGMLLGTMQLDSKRKVLRWAEKDFSWFSNKNEWEEILASKVMKRCKRCDIEGETEDKCEETILLKLWKDLSWKKVRRMKHRLASNDNNEEGTEDEHEEEGDVDGDDDEDIDEDEVVE